MTPRVNRNLNQWYSTHTADVLVSESTRECTEWKKVRRLVSIGTAHEFTIATRAAGGSSLSRARDCVSFLDPEAPNGISYGRVISFFQHQCPATHKTFSWALVDCFVVIYDSVSHSPFFERTELSSGSRLLDIQDIISPIGLLRRKDNNRRNSWWIAQGYRMHLPGDSDAT